MSAEIAELVGLGVSLRHAPVSPDERARYQEAARARAAAAAADLALRARIGANGPHGPSADAAVLFEAGFFPVGSMLSPDYAPPAPGIAEI